MEETERAKRAIAQNLQVDESAVAHFAGSLSTPDDPGVPLRFTPGFMLSPRFAGSTQVFKTLIRTS